MDGSLTQDNIKRAARALYSVLHFVDFRPSEVIKYVFAGLNNPKYK